MDVGPGFPDDPISTITIQQFADLGYEVDVSQADPYELPYRFTRGSNVDTELRSGDPTVPVDYANDMLLIPVEVVDRQGNVIRTLMPE